MATKEKHPMTPAIRVLKTGGHAFSLNAYTYEERGGTKVAARELGVNEHSIIKTLVMEDENNAPLIILMHGDKEVSTKSLARTLGVKAISPCDPKNAEKHTGYKVGGTSPFGTRKNMPIYVEASILDLPEVLINAGSRGLLAAVSPKVLLELLHPTSVNVAI